MAGGSPLYQVFEKRITNYRIRLSYNSFRSPSLSVLRGGQASYFKKQAYRDRCKVTVFICLYEGPLSLTNILQKAFVIRCVVFLLFLLCFQADVRLVLLRKRVKFFCHFLHLYQYATSFPRVPRSPLLFLAMASTIDVILSHIANASKFVQR